MSGGFPLITEICNGNAIGTATGLFVLGGTKLTPNATAHIKGSWTQLTSSSPIDADIIEITAQLGSVSGENTNAFDIGIGGAGSEIAVFPNLIANSPGQFTNNINRYLLPCSIPAGTRIAGRCQSHVASGGGTYVSFRLFSSSWQAADAVMGVDAIGFNTATTTGVAVTAGNATMGSWTQMVASSAVDYAGLIFCGDNTAARAAACYLIDIGVGGAGSEVVLIPGISWGNNYSRMCPLQAFMTPIPAGTRIAIRADDNDSGSGIALNATLYGIYA